MPRTPVTIARTPIRISSLVSFAHLLKSKSEVPLKKKKIYWHDPPAQDRITQRTDSVKKINSAQVTRFFNPSSTSCHGNHVPYFYRADVHRQTMRLVPLGSNRQTCSCQRKREEGNCIIIIKPMVSALTPIALQDNKKRGSEVWKIFN